MHPSIIKNNIEPFSGWQSKANAVNFIISGGTIDSLWDPQNDTAKCGAVLSVIPDHLRLVRLNRPVYSVQAAQKDSRQLNPDDKSAIIDEVVSANIEAASVVTTGTYAMPDIAALLVGDKGFKALEGSVRVVFTGALTPIAFTNSDGPFNLGASLAALDSGMPNGAAVCMGGKLIRAGKVIKDTNATTFTPTEQSASYWGEFKELTMVSAGGTIDFQADGLDGLEPRASSAVKEYFQHLHLNQKANFFSVSPKDSRDLSESEIDAVAERIRKAPTRKVLLTMGLFKMDEVVKTLRERIKRKTILVTGSRLPLADTASLVTDAPFNLGYAWGRLAAMKHEGVHIALGGHILRDGEEVMSLFTPEEQKRILEMRRSPRGSS